MFQESEVINLVFAVLAVGVVLFVFPKKMYVGFGWIWAGFCLIIASLVFTVVEGIFWSDLFQNLEHISYAASGCCFAIGCLRLQKHARTSDEETWPWL